MTEIKYFEDIKNIFNLKEIIKYTCDSKIPKDDTIPKQYVNYFAISLIDYFNDKTIAKSPLNGLIPLIDIIQYSQRQERMVGSEELDGCGPDGAKGPGTKQNTIQIPDDNKYILIYTNRANFNDAGNRIYDLNHKLHINPEIVLDNKVYHIFGSILYSYGGSVDPKNINLLIQKGNGGGHYIYDRFYISDEPYVGNNSANELPFITYNDDSVKYQDKDINIENKSFFIIYKFVKKLPVAQPSAPLAPAPAPASGKSKTRVSPEAKASVEESKQRDSKILQLQVIIANIEQIQTDINKSGSITFTDILIKDIQTFYNNAIGNDITGEKVDIYSIRIKNILSKLIGGNQLDSNTKGEINLDLIKSKNYYINELAKLNTSGAGRKSYHRPHTRMNVRNRTRRNRNH